MTQTQAKPVPMIDARAWLDTLETSPEQRQYRAEDCEGHRWMFATLR
jgi:hypothetical protein